MIGKNFSVNNLFTRHRYHNTELAEPKALSMKVTTIAITIKGPCRFGLLEMISDSFRTLESSCKFNINFKLIESLL